MRFWESLKIAAGFEKRGSVPTGLIVDKVTAGSGPLKMEWKAVSEITNDEIRIAKFLSDSFIEKRIMERKYEDEPATYVLESLKSLYSILDDASSKFFGALSERDRFYGSLLLLWKTAVKDAKSKMEEAISDEEKDRQAYRRFELLESSDILRADDSVPKILSEFRLTTYPIARVFIDLLPDSNVVKVKAEKKLALVKASLLEHFGATGDVFLEPEWDVEIPE